MNVSFKGSFYSLIIKILKLRKGKITGVEHILPKYELIRISSDGTTLEKTEEDEKLIITFETKQFRTP